MERDFNIHNWQAKFLKEESSNRQSAVGWLEQKVWELDDEYFTIPARLMEMISYAKEQEEKQIIEAFEAGGSSETMNGQEYYNEVYK